MRVLDGSPTAVDLAVELENLMPGMKDWVVEEKGSKTFCTYFPSLDVLNCAINWGLMDLKKVKGQIRFEKEVDNEVYKYEMNKVWVQFRGLPKDLWKFSIIWAVGTILGVPCAVDMKFTDKFGRARLKVVVLDPSLIPNLVDVGIGEFIYELQFQVEDELDSDDPIVIDMDAPMDEDPKESEPNENENENGKGKQNKASEKLDDKGTKASGTAPEKPADPAAKAPNAKEQPQPIEQQTVVSDNSSGANKPIVLLTRIGASDVGGKLCKVSSMSTRNNSRDKSRALKEGTVSLVRSSKRMASFSSQDSLERASKLKATKNLEGATSKGKGSKIASFIPLMFLPF